MRSSLALMSLAILACCGGPKWSDEERDAINACVNAAIDSFPLIYPTISEEPMVNQMGDLDQAELAVTDDSRFVFRFPNRDDPQGDAFVCHGSLVERHIEHIDSGNFVARGENNAGWRY